MPEPPTLPKQNAGEVAIQSFGILMNFCTFVKLTFFNPRTSLRQIPLKLIGLKSHLM